ncbi:MAG: hypothetical protein KKB74_12050 [Bacteroidetes bacterium]|nr:hypothetical protein [Bacteroidota bacterium]
MSQNIIYKYTFVSKKPYFEMFKYKNVFQIIPHLLTLKSENTLIEYHYLNILEINLNEFYKLVNTEVNINKIFSDYETLEAQTEKAITLSQAEPLIKMDHFIAYPKWIILNVLTVLTNYKHFDYSEEISDGWFKKLPPKGKKIEWGKKLLPDDGIRIQSYSSSKNSTVEMIESSEYLKTVSESGEKIKYPSDIYVKLDYFFYLDENDRECYISSIALFNQAINSHSIFGSQSIVSFVSSIENLVHFTHRNTKVEKCNCCNQDKYRVTKKFNDFVDLYSEGFYTRNELKKMIGDVYAKRSSIVHKGNLFPHELALPLWSENYFDSSLLKVGFESLTRYVLNQWLRKYCT